MWSSALTDFTSIDLHRCSNLLLEHLVYQPLVGGSCVFQSEGHYPKCQPFFQVLNKAFQWDAHCKEAFMALKTYLSFPPILVSPSEGELLILYLAVSDFSTSVALVRERYRVQQPIYYCIRALRGAEERYPKMEKLILALVTTSKKLRPYFQAHTIKS